MAEGGCAMRASIPSIPPYLPYRNANSILKRDNDRLRAVAVQTALQGAFDSPGTSGAGC